MKLLYATGPYRYAGHGLRGGSLSAESRDRPHEEGESTGNEVGEQATLDTTFQKKTWSIEIKVYSGLLCTRNTYIHSFFIRTFLIRTLRLSMLRTYPRLRQRTSLFCPIIFCKMSSMNKCNWQLSTNSKKYSSYTTFFRGSQTKPSYLRFRGIAYCEPRNV